MPEVRALKSFRGRYGLIRAGQSFQCEPGYLTALLKNKLVQLTDGHAEPGPEKNRSIPEAPGKAGKDQGGKGGAAPGGTVPPVGAGKGLTSASLPAARASHKKTPVLSGAGAKKGKKAKKTPENPDGAV